MIEMFQIRQWVIDMGAEHSDIVNEFLVTTSYEGREMRGLKVSLRFVGVFYITDPPSNHHAGQLLSAMDFIFVVHFVS